MFKIRLTQRAGPHVPENGEQYTRGEVFATKEDLSLRWPEKCERVPDNTPVTPKTLQEAMDQGLIQASDVVSTVDTTPFPQKAPAKKG